MKKINDDELLKAKDIAKMLDMELNTVNNKFRAKKIIGTQTGKSWVCMGKAFKAYINGIKLIE